MVSNLIDKDGRQSKGVLLLRTLAMPSWSRRHCCRRKYEFH